LLGDLGAAKLRYYGANAIRKNDGASPRGAMVRLRKEALASGPKTKELAIHVMAANKGLDTGDKVLAHAMAQRMIHALRQQWRRGQLQDGGKISGARVWALGQRRMPLVLS
jgi:hypothetical protein